MTIDRALEIIASHGADARRWPATEGAQVLALAGDPRIAAALADARSIDALLADWVVDDTPAGRIDLAAITGLPQQRPQAQPAWRGWMAGGAIAAAVAALAVLTPMQNGPGSMRTASTTQIAMISNVTVPSATVESGLTSSDADAFAIVFTPTADEDDLI